MCSRRVFGHSLVDTCVELLAHSPSFAEVQEEAKRLDRFYIPTRYPKTEAASDDALRLARKTEWSELAEGFNIGLGQRILATDSEDYPLLECRTVDLQPAGKAP